MTEPVKKPTTPSDDDCCGGGACNPCVWDDYYEKLQHWRIQQAKFRELTAQNGISIKHKGS